MPSFSDVPVMDLAKQILGGDLQAAGFLADALEDYRADHPMTAKFVRRLRTKDGPRLITICEIVAQFGTRRDRRHIKKAQRYFMGRHHLYSASVARLRRHQAPTTKYLLMNRFPMTRGSHFMDFLNFLNYMIENKKRRSSGTAR